jgi:hypothetical protein
MDDKIIWIFYNGICLILTLMMIKGTGDKAYKTIGLFFALTFIVFLIAHFGVNNIGGYGIIILTVGYILFSIKITKSNINLIDKVFLTILPSGTILKLYFGALHLTHFTEITLFSILTLIIATGYFITLRFIKKNSQQQREAFETNGLFGAILLSTLIY